MNAFILRPFGTKDGIDFETVKQALIVPALSSVGVNGSVEYDRLGPDMLELLITSDFVVVDVTLPIPWICYELGLAHALRDKRTIMLAAATRERPFDLLGEQYCLYDAQNPSASIRSLVEILRAAVQSERIDSPVYVLVPGLQPPRTATIPPGFQSELNEARRARNLGHLRLLSEEVRAFHWRADALKAIGDAQFSSRDMVGARDTLEYMLKFTPDDSDATLKLGMVYQRLNDPRRSDEAITRALDLLGPRFRDRAEALISLGRNAKNRWLDAWRVTPPERWRTEALRSPHLKTAYDYYRKAFLLDLNAFFGGISALALGTVTLELAETLPPEAWSDSFDDDAGASFGLATLRKEVASLATGVALSLEAASERASGDDVWLDISRADFELLTSTRPQRAAERYRRAMSRETPFVADAALSLIYVYRDLGVLKENTQAALDVLERFATQHTATPAPTRNKALLFVGHAIDAPGRAAPRFPASAEPAAREAIQRAVDEETRGDRSAVVGVAGASSGGDILFHEACESAGVAIKICLAVPATEYAHLGVTDAGPTWEQRFRELIARHPDHQVLSQTAELPAWLRRNAPYDFWGRDTTWRYQCAAAVGDVTVIALWDGKQGAVGDLVRMAKERGAKVVVLDAERLFAVPDGR